MEQVSLPGAAIRAERPVRSADADPPLPGALGAFLKVGRIADHPAAGADRLAVLVADGGLRIVPQWAHCWVLVLATQLRQHHSPSIRR